jgi:hypothetical protein
MPSSSRVHSPCRSHNHRVNTGVANTRLASRSPSKVRGISLAPVALGLVWRWSTRLWVPSRPHVEGRQALASCRHQVEALCEITNGLPLRANLCQQERGDFIPVRRQWKAI